MRRLALAALLMLTLVGCSAITNIVELNNALDDAGFTANTRMQTTNGHSVLYVTILSTDGSDTETAATRVSEVVWTSYHDRYDELVVNVNGETALSATEADLVDRFGEHPPGFVADHADDSDFTPVIVVTLVAAVLLAGLVFLVWWRGRRPVR